MALDEAQTLAVPALAGGLWVGGGHMGRMAGWMLLFLVVPSILWAVLEYLAFRFHIAGEDLVLDSGVLRRRHRVIPLTRMQSVEVRESALQRMMGVVELHVDTAGGETAEAVLSVLGAREAEILRSELLARRVERGESAAAPQVLARLTARDLAFAGATSNHAGIAAAILIGLVELAYQLPLPVPLPGIDLRVLFLDRPSADLIRGAAVLGVGALLVAWTLSITGALLTYHGFILEKGGGELRQRYGALARTEGTIPLQRVQAVRIEESLLRRPFDIAALAVVTAGGTSGEGSSQGLRAYLPFTPVSDVYPSQRRVPAGFGGF